MEDRVWPNGWFAVSSGLFAALGALLVKIIPAIAKFRKSQSDSLIKEQEEQARIRRLDSEARARREQASNDRVVKGMERVIESMRAMVTDAIDDRKVNSNWQKAMQQDLLTLYAKAAECESDRAAKTAQILELTRVVRLLRQGKQENGEAATSVDITPLPTQEDDSGIIAIGIEQMKQIHPGHVKDELS